MARLFFDPEALAELSRLEGDERSYGRLLDRVDLWLSWLEEDSGHGRCRGVRFQGGLWYLHLKSQHASAVRCMPGYRHVAGAEARRCSGQLDGRCLPTEESGYPAGSLWG